MKIQGIVEGYKIIDKLFENKKSIIFRASKFNENKSYIIKVLNVEFPSEEEINDFTYQSDIINHLNIKGIPKTVDFIDIYQTKALVFEDDEAVSLGSSDFYLFSLEEKLDIFYKVLTILEELHKNKIIHKDINPSNIIYNSLNKFVGIIDFENASILSDEKISFSNSILEGTLDYISPEQTGRLNKSIDYRTDLYSLGATFYEIFSGQKLFKNSKDLLELIYFQVAKEPLELCYLDSSIPKAISNIIKKLLAKNVEDRYQSATGVKEDILFCINQFKNDGVIEEFDLAKKDKISNFFVSEKLYGRDAIIDVFTESYTKASLESFEIVMIAGEKGGGKSALALELKNIVLKNKGVFNYGKFNKNHINYPYGALELFSGLVKNLLSEKNSFVEKKKREILEALGGNGKLLFDFIPELKFIIGEQPDIEILPPTETKNRLMYTFTEFLKVFMTEKNPLVVFLDDFQFANEVSFDIIKTLIGQVDIKNLMLVISYGKSEKNKNLEVFLNSLSTNSKANITNFSLKNLGEFEIKNLLKDSTSYPIDNIDSLISLIHSTTKGVPFLVRECIRTLSNKRILTFDETNFIWIWDKNESEKINYLNEEELAKDLLSSCTDSELNLLKTLVIFGENFNFNLVNNIFYKNKFELEKKLYNLLSRGFFEISDESKRKNLFSSNFKFKSQTLFNLIDQNIDPYIKDKLHLTIGQTLMETIHSTGDDNLIFETLTHLNFALKNDLDKHFNYKIANLNYKAGIKSRNNSAFKMALHYFEIAFDFYKEKNDIPEALLLDLYEVSYSCSEYEKMEYYYEIARSHIKNEESKLKLIEIKIYAHLAKGEHKIALNFALDALKELGVSLPYEVKKTDILKNIMKIKMLLIGKRIDKLSELPLLSDKKLLGTMRILGAASVISYLISQEHFMLIAMKQVELSLKYGNALQSPFAYTTYGVILCGALGELDNGYKFGQEALKLLDRFDTNQYVGKTRTCAYLFNLHWKEPLNTVHRELNKAYELSLKSGDMEFASWALLCRDFHGFFASKNLKSMSYDLEFSTKHIKHELKQESQYYTSNSFLCLVEELCGLEKTEAFFEEQKLQERFERENYKNGLYYNYSNAMIKNLIMGNYKEAYLLSKKSDLYVESVISTVNYPEFYFYSILSYIMGNYDNPNENIKLLKKKMSSLKKWAKFGPLNHGYKSLFVENLYKVFIKQKKLDYNIFDSIIKNCLQNGFLGDGALISEIVAFLARINHNESMAKVYINNSVDLYTRWGAYGKVQQLNEEHKLYINESVSISGSSKNGFASLLDSTSLIRISELLTAESQYEKLVSKMTELVMENTGAEKGYYISKKNNELFVETEFNINNKELKELSKPFENYHNSFPKTLINYSYRTGESFVFQNAYEEQTNFVDEYITINKIKSLLIFPVIAQNKIIGIFYLENNLLSGVFTRQKIEFLKVILLQGAVSIENLRMFNNLEEKVKERTHELKLVNEDLEKQKKAAEEAKLIADEATKAKSEFLANMSHEIRTPMNGVMGLTYLLKKTHLNERQTDYLNKIEDSAKHLLNVINDILDFSKIEAGKIELDLKNFRLEDIFSNISNVFIKPIEDRGLELIYYVDPQVPKYLIGDDLKIKQTLINLVGNAVKFTHKGEIILKVELLKKYETKASIRFSVKDTGIGLTTDQQNKLFKSFTQADGSITRKYGGTGLGLTISKSFVELMGGTIGLISESNKGSTFYFTVDLEIGDEILKKDIFNLSGLKTLVVDDSETSIEILKTYMENFGCIVDSATSGKAALELIKNSVSNPYKLMLIDWKMPDMDGIETITEIKKNKDFPDIPLLIMVSAFNIDEIKKYGSKLKIDGYLTKPVQQSLLLDTIANSLDSKENILDPQFDPNSFIQLSGKILLVEDNYVNQIVAQQLLESFGLSVEIAEDGLNSIEACSKKSFDLIFMDIQMPGIDGYETTRRLKAMKIKTPIIAMTANVMKSDVEKCLEAGMEDFIGKPIEPDKLYKTVKKWLTPSTASSKINEQIKIDNEDLPTYEGINIKTGLNRAMGKLVVYNKVLLIFINEFKSAQIKIDEFIINHDSEEFAKYIHNLKGASGNISADSLYQKSIDLENKIKDWSFSSKDIEEFYYELNLVLSNEKFFQNGKATTKVPLKDLNILTELKNDFLNLAKALKISSFDSEDIVESIEKSLDTYEIPDIKEIKLSIINFEYEQALELLDTFMKKNNLY